MISCRKFGYEMIKNDVVLTILFFSTTRVEKLFSKNGLPVSPPLANLSGDLVIENGIDDKFIEDAKGVSSKGLFCSSCQTSFEERTIQVICQIVSIWEIGRAS